MTAWLTFSLLAMTVALVAVSLFGRAQRKRGESDASGRMARKSLDAMARFVAVTRRKVPRGSDLRSAWLRRVRDDEESGGDP